MVKTFIKLCAALLCIATMCAPANASSIFISGMTLLGTKSVIFEKTLLDERVQDMHHKMRETECLAIGLYHEARGEPVIGQYAVAATIMNRVRSTAYPDTVCGVVYQNSYKKYRCQFSFACDDIADEPQDQRCYRKMQRLAKTVLEYGIARESKFIGKTMVVQMDSMTHYHRHDARPVWSTKLQKLSTLGTHVFFKSDRVTRRYAY